MCARASCFESSLRTVSNHGSRSNSNCGRCVNGFSRTRSSNTSPTPSRSRLAILGLLTFSAALLLAAPPPTVVHRWALAGDPHGLAIGSNGTIYVGLSQPQAGAAIDHRHG